jgi:hypothetical protein
MRSLLDSFLLPIPEQGKKATLPAEAPTAAAGRTEDLRRVLEAAGGS